MNTTHSAARNSQQVHSSQNNEQTVEGFLLSRQWRDGPDGVHLSYWASSSAGPLHINLPSQKAVCFTARDTVLSLPPGTERKTLQLRLLGAGHADALYFESQRALLDFRDRINGAGMLAEADIKPTDRFLMERFINASFVASGQINQRNGYIEMQSPNLKSADFLPDLKTLSLDIETRGMSRQLYSIGAAGVTEDRVFMVGDAAEYAARTTAQHGYELEFCRDEKETLQRFFAWLATQDPDLIIGWSVVNFDLEFLFKKCNELNISFAFGRGREEASILQPSRDGAGPRVARLPGRPVLDGIDLLKAGFWSFESFSLDNVAHKLLGKNKLISSGTDKVAEINRLYREDKAKLADYNIEDCKLVREIFSHAGLIDFAVQRSAITGLAIDRMGGSVAAFDHLYLPRLHRQGFVAGSNTDENSGLGSPGGYVMDSQPGLFRNVLVLDFKSLYPSIIRTFFIDPLGLAVGLEEHDNTRDIPPEQSTERSVAGFHGARFSRDKHILPAMIGDLWQARDQAKKEKNVAMSQAIKIIMNSFYGVLGASGCRFYNQQLASSITRRGHEIITRSRDFIEQAGYQVIYGDTDSVFVLLDQQIDEKAADAIGHQLMHSLNDWWSNTLEQEHQLTSRLEVEYETHYLRFLMPTVRGLNTGSKKRYAGLVRSDNNELAMIFKGLEAVRTDWTPLARDFQRELFHRIFTDQPFEDFVKSTASALQAGEKDSELVYRKRLRRKLEDYQRNVPPHVQAARKQKTPGHWVNYIITRNGPEPLDCLESPPDYQHYMDKQLAPAADSILHFMDTSFATLTDAQMQMF